MKLAILGTDEDIRRLATAALRGGHDIVWVGDVRPCDSKAFADLAPGRSDQADHWELLLDHTIADAVLVGRGAAPPDVRGERLKRLAGEAVPMLVSHPLDDSVLLYYELDMIRRQTGAVLRHFNPLAGHPLIDRLAEWVRDAHPTIGEIHQVACQRRVADATRRGVLVHLARDVEWLAAVAGTIHRVSAMGPTSRDASFASLQVQLAADGPATLHWSVVSAPGSLPDLEVAFRGERGAMTLQVRDDDSPDGAAVWQLESTDDGEQRSRPLAPYDAALAAIHALDVAVGELEAEHRGVISSWTSATRAMEVVDAVELSLERGRTIEVHQQQLTERVAFRGTMAAIGCAVLLFGLLGMLFVAMLGGAEEALGQRLLPGWPVALLGVLALFLLMQGLPLLVRPLSRKKKAPDSSTAEVRGP